LSKMPVKLGDVADIFVGTQTSADSVFVLEQCHEHDGLVEGYSKALEHTVIIESPVTRAFLRGKDIRRYEEPTSELRLVCPYIISPDSCSLLKPDDLKSRYPSAYRYLESARGILAEREKGHFEGLGWYQFGYPKSMTQFQYQKIAVPDYNNVASFTFDAGGHFFKTGYGVVLKRKDWSALYLLGLLNSQLLFSYLLSIGTTLRGGYVRFWTQYLAQLPLPAIDVSAAADMAMHDEMVRLVNQMLTLHRQLAAAGTDREKSGLQLQIAALDAAIDSLVFRLYGLSTTDQETLQQTSRGLS
jgi:hypothetical protein